MLMSAVEAYLIAYAAAIADRRGMHPIPVTDAADEQK